MSHETNPPVGVGASGDGPQQFGLVADFASQQSTLSESRLHAAQILRSSSDDGSSDGNSSDSSSSGTESGNRRLPYDRLPFGFPPQNNTDTTGDRDRDGDGGEEVTSDGRGPFGDGRVDPVANDLMRALFLPIFACSPLDGKSADPRCTSVYKVQAQDAIRAWEFLNAKLSSAIMINQSHLIQLNELEAEHDLDELTMLRLKVDETNGEIADLDREKKAIEEQFTVAELNNIQNQAMIRELQEKLAAGGCDARTVAALRDVNEVNLAETIESLKQSGTCDPEQMNRATKLLNDAVELRRFREERAIRKEAERAKREQDRRNKEARRENMTEEIKFLDIVNREMTRTLDNDFTDKDHEECSEDIVKFATKRFGIKPEEGKPPSLSYLGVVDDENENAVRIYSEILELIVQKAGKIRMMVRFRDKPIKRGDSETSVKNSYLLGEYNKNNIMVQKNEFEEYLATLSEDEKGDTRNVKNDFAKMPSTSKPYVNTPFVGYRLDSSEYERVGVYRTLLASKGTGETEAVLRADDIVQRLTFERVFFEESQEEVFDTLRSFVWSANNTKKPMGIFAYGGTGSGKTHTLIGTEKDPGVLTRLLEEQNAPGMNTENIEVRIFETHPRKPPKKRYQEKTQSGGVNDLNHRVIDLVELSRNEKVTINETNNTIKMSLEGECEAAFYDMDTRINGTTGLRQKVCGITDVKSLYEGVNLTGCKSGFEILNPDKFETNCEKLSFDGESTNTEIVGAVEGVLKYRRTESTGGNKDGSSRSHLVVSIKVKTIGEDVAKKFFVVDMAGKEALFRQTNRKPLQGEGTFAAQWATSEGINQSLDAFTRYLALTKCKLFNSSSLSKFSLRKGIDTAYDVDVALQTANCVVGDDKKSQRMPHLNDGVGKERKTYVDTDARETFMHIKYKDDPLFFLTHAIWSNVDSKVMMFACVYPLTKSYPNPNKAVPEMWNTHFGETGENLYDKFKRDLGILREMDYIQKIKKYVIPPPEPEEPKTMDPRRSARKKK